MPTNIDSDGNYPLSDSIDDVDTYIDIPSFNNMWKTEIQFLPEFGNDKKSLEFYKKLSEKVYNSVCDYVYFDLKDKSIIKNDAFNYIQNIATQAYNDGLDDGCLKSTEIDKKTFDDNVYNDFLNELIDHIKTLRK